ncbi:allantoinase [Paenibacillus swuensis]|uniref:Allantoinase n=1 Tax=Paenibacillus swuensis TaxID=1178515 RepID=A0A172TKU2_9BACL|nr:allantoinase AllB [Paenibacillus swuensis]ANE47658.1 allantoinase [Paenibacillus swuensis]
MGEPFDLIIQGGTVVLPERVAKLDIGIRHGKIAEISESLVGTVSEVLDATDKLVMAGLIDMHVHLNEPGFGHWEGFETGSAALAAGGCTFYADMPLNGNPATVSTDALKLKAELASGKSAVDYTFWGGLVPDNLDALKPLAEAGVFAFKAFMSEPGGEGEERLRRADDWTLYQGMKRIAAFGGILALHAESDSITARLAEAAVAEGRMTAADFAASRPIVAETEAVNRALYFARETGCALHFVHISSSQAVDLIDAAKAEGLDVTLETCPHYLVLTETDMGRIGPAAKCAPPLRSGDAQEALWEQLSNGRIDMITSDHSPCPESLKNKTGQTFMEAWGGISGAQNTMELMIGEGHVRKGIPLTELSAMLSSSPATRFGFGDMKGRIALGFDADLVIIDPSNRYVLNREHLYQKHKHNPYLGREMLCRVVRTISRGVTVYSMEEGLKHSGAGQWAPKTTKRRDPL